MTSLINIKHNATTSINTDTQPQRPKNATDGKKQKTKTGDKQQNYPCTAQWAILPRLTDG